MPRGTTEPVIDPNATDEEGSDQPKYVTSDELGQMVNAAVTAQLKRGLSKVTDDFKKELATQLAALKPSKEEHEETKKSSKQDPELAALQRSLAETQAAMKASEERAVAAEKQRREDKAFADLRTHLSTQLKPEMVDIAAEHLFYARKRVEFDENGNPLFKAKRSPGGGLPEEDILLPLAEGVNAFVKSKEAAPFLPAPGPQAGKGGKAPPSGSTQSKQTGSSTKGTSDEARVQRAMENEQRLRDAGHNF